MKYLILLTFIAQVFYAQVDWERWEAKQVSYEVPQIPNKSYVLEKSTFPVLVLSGLKNIYYFFISNLDGDNCPFHPSCSNFFVESVKLTNPLKGSLMFADRFTRDINFFKNPSQYHIHTSGKFYDPVVNYTLNSKDYFLTADKKTSKE